MSGPRPSRPQCIPLALEGKDVIGLAQTGTGKTAAFALPIIQRLAQRTELAALVLAPTRELAQQITGVFDQLGKSSGIRVATIVGGIPMDNDYKALRSWPNVLVATPGRLIDHITYRSVSLSEIEVLVVDEADRMHDMGFIPQIRRILSALPDEAPDDDVHRDDAAGRGADRADEHDATRCASRSGCRVPRPSAPSSNSSPSATRRRRRCCWNCCASADDGRVLVFVRTKRGVDRLARDRGAGDSTSARIHGDREQCERDKAMNGFREGRYRILIATDIAARGIDVADIEHVINYDFPLSARRTTSTASAGRRASQATGLATSFVTSDDKRYLLDVKKLLGDKLPLTEDVKEMLGRRSCGRHGSGRGEGRHQGSGSGPRAEGMQHGRRGGSRRGGPRPQGQADGASRSEGHVETRHPTRDAQGEVNGNVGGPEAVQAAPGTAGPGTSDKPRRHRRRGGRGRGKSAGQGQPQTHEAA